MSFYVYIIQNNINYKIYVGKSTEKKSSRFDEHIRLASQGKKNKNYSLIHAAFNKYGVEHFSFTIIEYFALEQEALEAEKFWIEFFRTDVNRFGNEYGYNLTAGGDGFSKPHTEETKAKIKNTILKQLQDPLVKAELIIRLQNGKSVTIIKPTFNIGCKIDWPSDTDLVKMVKNFSYKGVARKLGVSNIAVRERLKRRGLYPINCQ